MEQGLETTEAERRAVAEVLWMWAALFDGPPAEEVWRRFRSQVWPRLSEALAGNGDLAPPPAAAADLREEYERRLLVPDAGGSVSPYDDEEPGDGGVSGSDLWMLASALGLPWRKDGFVPGRAFPVRPDHVSVLLALWAAVTPLSPTAAVAGRHAGEWAQAVGCAAERVLRRLAAGLPDGGPYRFLAASAAAYARGALDWQAGHGQAPAAGREAGGRDAAGREAWGRDAAGAAGPAGSGREAAAAVAHPGCRAQGSANP